MATEKRRVERVIDDKGGKVQVLFETSAEQVTIADTENEFTSSNVEGALQELATGVANAGKVDNVVNPDGTSIVKDKIAQLKDAVVKEAGKVTHHLKMYGQDDDDDATSGEIQYDGSVEKSVRYDASYFTFRKNSIDENEYIVGLPDVVSSGTYNKVSVDSKGRVYHGSNEDYALKAYVDEQDGKKLDKAGGTVTGALSVNGGLTVGGNLTVNGTTTTVDSTTLQVKDKLIEVAHGNTTKLTTPAGLVAPKYDGTNSGALVFDGDGIASVGDVALDASGNIDTTKSNLQPLATRSGLVDGNLVQYDGTNQTLVDSKAKIGDLQTKKDNTLATTEKTIAGAINEVKETADNALSKANTNASAIKKITDGTTTVPNAQNAAYAKKSDTANAATTAETATTATTANKVGHSLTLRGGNDSAEFHVKFNGASDTVVRFSDDLYQSDGAFSNSAYIGLTDTGVQTGTYSAVTVDSKGRVTEGSQVIEWGKSGQTTPTSSLVVGGLFFELQS